MIETTAVYAGSFDPVTLGHLDLIERAAALFDHVIVAIGIHPTRKPLFAVEERLALLRTVTKDLPSIQIDSFHGLLIDYCRKKQAKVIVRGLRVVTDFDYELQIAHANADLCPEVDTVFLPSRTEHGFVSASLVREIASHGGDITRYAPPEVVVALREKYKNGPAA